MSFRPYIQRAFLSWLRDARPSLKRQVVLCQPTNRKLAFRFDVGQAFLFGTLTDYDIMIGVQHGGMVWDYLGMFDAPQTVISRGGYACRACPQPSSWYPSRRALLDKHLFSPFAEWINYKLAPATSVVLFEVHGGTWAELRQGTDAPQGSMIALSLVL